MPIALVPSDTCMLLNVFLSEPDLTNIAWPEPESALVLVNVLSGELIRYMPEPVSEWPLPPMPVIVLLEELPR